MTLGENIKRLRQRGGLTQEALAGIIGVTAQAVSKWECGDSLPDGALFVPLADALGTSLDALFGREAVYETELYPALIRLINNTPQKEQLSKVREICWQTEKGLFGPDSELRYEPDELSHLNDSSTISYDTGFTCISNRPELPFFTVFPEPRGGYGGALSYDETYRAVFAALGNAPTLRAFFTLYGKACGYTFEAGVLAAECGILEDELSPVMENLLILKAVHRVAIMLNGEERCLYTVNQRYEWVAVFALLNELMYHGNTFSLQISARNKPYLSKTE